MGDAQTVVVLAGSLAQFRQWCRAAGLDPESRRIVYARDAKALRGHRGVRVVRCGTWHLRPDRRELDQAARAIEESGEMASAT